MDKQLQQAVSIFKSESAYKKLFNEFKKKYESLGQIGGTVSAGKFTNDELEVIGGFFGMPGERLAKRGSISVTAFEQQLAETRFGDVEMKKLLDEFYGEEINSKKQRRAEKEASVRGFLNGLRESYPVLWFWFDYLLEKTGEGRWVWALAEKDSGLLERLIGHVLMRMQACRKSLSVYR